MSLQSVLITQTSPIFGAEIVGAIEHFWGFSWESSPVWQNPRWCEFLLGVGQVQECIFVGDFTTEGELLSYVLVQIRSIWLGYMGGFVIGGPNFRLLMSNDFVLNKKNSHGLENSPLFAEISRIFIQKWIVFVQYEPLQNLGFTKCNLVWKSFVEPYTLLLDLTLSEDELLAQMKQKGRYNIKLAEKKGVTVIKSIEPEGFDHFIRLLSETLGRDGFAGNSSAYYAGLLATRTHTDEGLYLASKDWIVMAAAILVIEGDQAIYYYGASTSDNELRKCMPAYLLQWKMIQIARLAGCRQYDFLGIAPPESTHHPLAGVSDFKYKFGGKVKVLPAKKIVVFRRIIYQILMWIRQIRWFFVK